ncbi:DUF6221 family protein [Streptomyces sp. NPDC090054]|uniref:DUF6221 family protein n=1 Tax=Streptomyces sp. NPDC090054 TaxID=3365933 RepID=UPI003819FAED
MDDLVQFLRARLDEDEQGCRAATAGPWYVLGGEASEYAIHTTTDCAPTAADVAATAYYGGGIWERADAEHIARHNPARVLAEVDAKRQALAHYERIVQHTLKSDGGADYLFAEGAVRKQIQYMALPYAGHLDYRPIWAPDQA